MANEKHEIFHMKLSFICVRVETFLSKISHLPSFKKKKKQAWGKSEIWKHFLFIIPVVI